MSYNNAVVRFLKEFAAWQLPLVYGQELPREYAVSYNHDTKVFTLVSNDEVPYVLKQGTPDEWSDSAAVEITIEMMTDFEDGKDRANVQVSFPTLTVCAFTCSLDTLFEEVLCALVVEFCE